MFSKLPIAALLAVITPSVQAQAVDEQPVVEVTSTRVAQTADSGLADVTIITRAAIDASGAADLVDLLRGKAGIDVAVSGGVGAQASLYMRGTNSNHVLVLIDGIRTAAAGTGTVDWSQFPLDAIERIEIVRGPRAAYWGSGAIGGVIQIFTRRLDGPDATVRYGSFADAAGSAGFGQWGRRGGFSVLAGLRHVTGFPNTTPDNFAYSPLDDGYRAKQAAAQAGYRFGGQLLSGTLLRNDADVEFAGGTTHTVNQTAGITLDGEVVDGWTSRLGIGNSRNDLRTVAYDSVYRSHRNDLTWQNTIDIVPGQAIVAGFDFVTERGANTNISGATVEYDNRRHDAGVFVGWNGHHAGFDWELAERHDHNSQFGGASTASAAAALAVGSGWRVTASIGQGFRAPAMNELYSPGYGGYYAGNPRLQPERSRSAEAGVEWQPATNATIRVTAYHTDVDDLIAFTGPLNAAENTARARIDGTELTGEWQAGSWTLHGSATLQRPRDAATGADLLRRPRRKAGFELSRDLGGRAQAGVQWIVQGRSQDIGGPLGGFALLGATLNIRVSSAWSLHLRAENLADRNYTVVRGFATQERSAWITLAWQPR